MVIELRQDRDFQQLLERSKTHPVLIFKHSTQCPISSQVYEDFTRFAGSAGEVACGVVLVIENRDVSDTIADSLKVQHESPQAIVVKDGHVTWHASHWSITTDSLIKALSSYGQPAHQRD